MMSTSPNTQHPDDPTQRFYAWATDEFGEVEGVKLFRALLAVQSIHRSVFIHGDFISARIRMLDIAMLFPDVGQLPAFPASHSASPE
jgi:hypothetical protein